MKLILKCLFALFSVFFVSCTSVVFLKDGHVTVPANSTFYKNRIYFDKELLHLIDTNSIYFEIEPSKPKFKNPNLKNAMNNRTGAYKFYSNGCFNLFYLNNGQNIDNQTFDPSYSGWRGIIYKRNGEFLGDMFVQLETDTNVISHCTAIFEFVGDTIKVNMENLYKRKYVKQKISDGKLNYRPNW